VKEQAAGTRASPEIEVMTRLLMADAQRNIHALRWRRSRTLIGVISHGVKDPARLSLVKIKQAFSSGAVAALPLL
jgi:hypothetical protein